MPRAARGVAVITCACACLAGHAAARPHARTRDTTMPMRVILSDRGARVANCLFASSEIAENVATSERTRDRFRAGDAIWARCYLPEKPGPSRAGDLVDSFTVDGQPAWQQAYDQPLPAAAESRSVPYGEVLRTWLQALKPGTHRIQLVGGLRRGKKLVPLYRGEFRYVR